MGSLADTATSTHQSLPTAFGVKTAWKAELELLELLELEELELLELLLELEELELLELELLELLEVLLEELVVVVPPPVQPQGTLPLLSVPSIQVKAALCDTRLLAVSQARNSTLAPAGVF